jgi:2-polyprenyl-3-methyl-5-hydroxy-6-metoxy-1,4-benzoquinol methylase
LILRTKDYNRRSSREVFDYFRCPGCKTIFLFPLPANLPDYYPPEYHSMPSSIEQLKARAEGECYKIDIVRRFVSGGRLLEIGPSHGSFAFLAKQAGFEVEAIEMDLRCCRFLEDVVGVRAIHHSDPAMALATAMPYDVVALWHVIEHLPDPRAVLGAISRKMLPGGILVIAAPNPSSFQFRVLGRYWTHIDAPRHTALIPAPVLSGFLGKSGLRTLMTTTTDAGSLGWNDFGWRESLSNLVPSRPAKTVLNIIGHAMAVALHRTERHEGLGSAYTIVFQKDQTP